MVLVLLGGSSELRAWIEVLFILVQSRGLSGLELMVHTRDRRSIGTSAIGFRRRRSP
jgi:hypothetical protein